MRKTAVIIISIGLLLSGSANAAKKRTLDKIKYPPLNKFQLPEIQKARTQKGIELRLIKNEELPLMDLRIIFKGGTVYDPPTQVGLAEVTADLLRIGGTKEWKGDRLDQVLDSKGIDLSIDAENDYFLVKLSCLREDLDDGISILAKIFSEPAFDPEKLEEIKTRGASAISRRNDQPENINEREFDKLIYGSRSPFAAVPEYEHLDNISRDDVSALHKRFFAPDNMMMGMIGPVEMEDFKKLVEKHFQGWDHKALIPAYPTVSELQHDFKVAFAEKSNLNQSYISLGHLGIKRDLSQQPAIMVFNAIFAQGFDSRLNNRVRTQMGLTYGIGGGIAAEDLFPGKTYVSTFTKSASTIEAIKAIFDEIAIIRKEKVADKELQDARDYFVNSFVFKYSSPAKILSGEMVREFYGLPEGYSEKLIEDIKKVTAEEVLDTAGKYLHPEKMVIFIVGKEEELEGKLSELGKVKKVDISIPPPALKEKIPPPTPETLAKGAKIAASLFKEKYAGYKGLKTLVTKGEMVMETPQGTFSLQVKSTTRFPDKRYMEINVMGMKMESIVNGKEGVNRQMGQEKAMTPDQVEKSWFGSMYDLFHARDKYKLQYLKEETVDGKKYDVLYIFDSRENWQKLFIHKESGLVEIEEKLSNVPGQAGVAREIKSDFRTVKGIPFAFKTETFIKDKRVMAFTVKEILVNPPVDPALFNLKKK